MIRWSDIDPSIPRYGWPRRRAIALVVLQVIGGTAFLLALLAVAYIAILFAAARANAL